MNDRSASAPAFAALRHALVRSRFRHTEPLLRLEMVALALLVAAFLFWQARIPLDGLARARGPAAVATALAALLALLAAAGGAVAFGRHRDALRGDPVGPAWLALPLEARELARHLAWESAGPAWLVALPALALLAAAWGLVPPWWLPLLAAAGAWMLAESVRVGTAVALRLAVAAVPGQAVLAPIERVLATASHEGRARRRPAPAWRSGPAWLALWRKDLAVTRAPSAARARVLPPLVFGAASAAMWMVPLEPPALVRALAFGLALIAAAMLAEWLVALSGSDPFAALRGLPVGAADVWMARFAWALGAVAALLVAHAVAARSLSPGALQVHLVWTGVAALAIAALGVNYGVTLFPRADLASRLLALSLGVALAASLMIPLSGWVLLLAAVIHSARRLPRWSRLEEA
jgi:hypothetical protein